MFEVFGDIKKQISTSGIKEPDISSFTLTMMRLSMLLTLTGCVLVTARNYIGDNISCITGFKDQEHKAIENYCFIASTFTIIDLGSDEAPHPGVGPIPIKEECEDGAEDCDTEDNLRRHAYYQWVPMVLLLQAAIYYLPKFLWDQRDKGLFKDSIANLDKVSVDKHALKKRIESSAQYFKDSLNTHRNYAVCFLLCEMISFSIAVGNLYFTNTFLGGDFFHFGKHAVHYLTQSASSPDNPLNEVFPKVTKCTWYKYGASGTINTHDSMCVLPLNIVNEKTYICLWIVYVATATFTGIVLLWHIILFCVPEVRNTFLVYMSRSSETKLNLQHLLPECNYGDWFLMYHYRKHMAYFKEWTTTLRKLNSKNIE
ncbi:unnamed protein product [Meganyctiphanes norvegica]|uniref:Innexin n=1 Tax=Meganyctiphanes norvegica TaxID=48144 RepID=A0AAV2RF98_MEGNR